MQFVFEGYTERSHHKKKTEKMIYQSLKYYELCKNVILTDSIFIKMNYLGLFQCQGRLVRKRTYQSKAWILQNTLTIVHKIDFYHTLICQ